MIEQNSNKISTAACSEPQKSLQVMPAPGFKNTQPDAGRDASESTFKDRMIHHKLRRNLLGKKNEWFQWKNE